MFTHLNNYEVGLSANMRCKCTSRLWPHIIAILIINIHRIKRQNGLLRALGDLNVPISSTERINFRNPVRKTNYLVIYCWLWMRYQFFYEFPWINCRFWCDDVLYAVMCGMCQLWFESNRKEEIEIATVFSINILFWEFGSFSFNGCLFSPNSISFAVLIFGDLGCWAQWEMKVHACWNETFSGCLAHNRCCIQKFKLQNREFLKSPHKKQGKSHIIISISQHPKEKVNKSINRNRIEVFQFHQ